MSNSSSEKQSARYLELMKKLAAEVSPTEKEKVYVVKYCCEDNVFWGTDLKNVRFAAANPAQLWLTVYSYLLAKTKTPSGDPFDMMEVYCDDGIYGADGMSDEEAVASILEGFFNNGTLWAEKVPPTKIISWTST